MKLGLDLRGGVHFLMEVDMDTALAKLQEQTMDSLRTDLREKNIPYASLRKLDDNAVEVRFRDNATRDQAVDYLSGRQRDLVIKSNGDNTLRAALSDARLTESRQYAVQQNITILRNRVNQLGVAEPLVQLRRCVGCPRSPQSLTDVSSWGFTALPPACNLNYLGINKIYSITMREFK